MGGPRGGRLCPFRSVRAAVLAACVLNGLAGCASLAPDGTARPEPSGPAAPVVSRRAPAEPTSATAVASAAGTHVVSAGETLYAIAFRHGLDYRELARLNGIASPYVIRPGQRLRLVGARQRETAPAPAPQAAETPARPAPRLEREVVAAPVPRPTPVDATSKPAGTQASSVQSKPPEASPEPAKAGGGAGIRWQWPTEGKPSRSPTALGQKGIEFLGSLGQPVRAAAAGEVVYAGNGLHGYGNLVIVKHDDVYISAYGNNQRLLVAEGSKVERGQPIAEMGAGGDGRASLHFEVRRHGRAVDPLQYLPPAP